jgi:hypothetical protein
MNAPLRPIVLEIRRQQRDSLSVAARIFKELEELDESIEIVAREIKRQGERSW